MVTNLLELVGVVCVAAFLYFVWPPLVLLGVGTALIVGASRVDR